MEKTLENLGIHGDGIGTTDIAHFNNLTSAMSMEEASALQMDVDQGYKQFVGIVAQGRKMQPEAVEKIAEGRVWDGATALHLGLVDKLGNIETAIAEAARLAKVPADNGFFIETAPENLLERFKRADQPVEAFIRQTILGSILPERLHQVATQLDFLLQKEDPRSIYAHSLLPISPVNLR